MVNLKRHLIDISKSILRYCSVILLTLFITGFVYSIIQINIEGEKEIWKNKCSEPFSSISTEHPFGCLSGYDVFQFIIRGCYVTLISIIVVCIPFLLFGLICGTIMGYYDTNSSRILASSIGVLNSFPKLLFVLLLGAGLSNLQGHRPTVMLFAFGVLLSPKLAELVSIRIKHFKTLEFINASISSGFHVKTIIVKHLLWRNCRDVIYAELFNAMALGILMEVTLTYFNRGYSYPKVSWGLLLLHSQSILSSSRMSLLNPPWSENFPIQAIVPILFITTLVIVFSVFPAIFQLKVRRM